MAKEPKAGAGGTAGGTLGRIEAEPTRSQHDSSGTEPTSEGLPSLEAPSLIRGLEPGEEIGSGLKLRDLADEVPLPPLQLGPEKYRILSLLGEGGMGRVYLAFDHDLKRRVALKLVKTSSGEAARRFIDEAQVMAQLEHPNIVPVYEVGMAGERRPFYTMKVVRGRTLRQVLEQLRMDEPEAEREWSLVRRTQLLVQVAQAVAYAHERGVVHRDLKPANIMLGSHGEVQVMDWGLSKVLAGRDQAIAGGDVEGSPDPSVTSAGRVVGTPWYMSPEQAMGDVVDQRTDVWALGVLLYELLTLKRPFEGGAREVMDAIVLGSFPAPRRVASGRAVPLALESVCLRAMSKSREERYPGAADLAADLQLWLEAEVDREKRHELAEHKAREGRLRLEAYARQTAELARLEKEAGEVERRLEPWRPVAEKTDLVVALDRVVAARGELVQTASAIVGMLEKALAFEEDNHSAREALADYYWLRFTETELAGDDRGRTFFAERVANYHDGKYAAELLGDGSLVLHTDPPAADAELAELLEEGFVHRPRRQRRLGSTPLGPTVLAMGSYLVTLSRPGFRPALAPVHVSRNRACRATVSLWREEEIGAGFVQVPRGPFRAGGDPEARGFGLAQAEPEIEEFAIGRFPVTFAEYLEFLDHLARTDPALALARSPRRAPDGGSYLAAGPDGRWRLEDGPGAGVPWRAEHPVIGVSFHDALAYCAWRSQQDGVEVRLPRELEWEKASRGVDGRSFPWGERFDPSLCNMRRSRRGRPAPDGVDSFPTDVSVYGVRGTAGNVRDWTATVMRDEDSEGRDLVVVRGGAWNLDANLSRSAQRFWLEPARVFDYVGFRLARSLRRG